jgi:hypothetical protein
MPSSMRKLLMGALPAKALLRPCIDSPLLAQSQPPRSGLVMYPSDKVHAVEALMTQAREAERMGNQSACEQALAKVQSLFDH